MSKTRYKINGRSVTAAEFRRHRIKRLAVGSLSYGPPAYSEANPGRSLALGCHFKEIDMMNDRLHQEGIVGIEYVKGKRGGECRITNNSKRSGRRKWMKVFGEMVGLGPLCDEESFD
jgi:hypothetical protein